MSEVQRVVRDELKKLGFGITPHLIGETLVVTCAQFDDKQILSFKNGQWIASGNKIDEEDVELVVRQLMSIHAQYKAVGYNEEDSQFDVQYDARTKFVDHLKKGEV